MSTVAATFKRLPNIQQPCILSSRTHSSWQKRQTLTTATTTTTTTIIIRNFCLQQPYFHHPSFAYSLSAPPVALKNKNTIQFRFYFTNGQVTKQKDPYAILGLQYGDGATSADIKQAFRDKARQLHPDVNTTDSPQVALKKFQQLQSAYEALIKHVSAQDLQDFDEWRMAIWRQGDRIAMDRTDVAGVKRKRPIQPVSSILNSKHTGRELGHPDGRGVVLSRGEYLGEKKRSSSVGTGRNKWVKPKEFRPWNGGASENRSDATDDAKK